MGKSGQYLVSFWEKVVSIVVSILTFFLQTTVVITERGGNLKKGEVNFERGGPTPLETMGRYFSTRNQFGHEPARSEYCFGGYKV